MNDSAQVSISALVITLRPEPEAESQALAALASITGLDLGEYHRPWLSAVLESAHPADDCRFLQNIPGIVLVEVTYVEVIPPASPTPAVATL